MRRISGFLECAAIIVLVLLGMVFAGNILRPTGTDGSVKSIKAFHELDENTVDVIGFGSSHLWRGLNPMTMYEEYGIGAWNYGANWQHINTTFLFMDDAFRTQSPKVVLVETYRIDKLLLDSSMSANGEIYYTRELKNSSVKREYLNESLGEDYSGRIAYYLPIVAFHSNWTTIEEDSFSGYKRVDYNKTKGFQPYDEITEIELPDVDNKFQIDLSQENIDVLDKIVDLCRKNNAELIFYKAPYQNDASSKYDAFMSNYAEENGCVYLNLYKKTKEIGLDGKTDFSDKSHLNTSGATKVAGYLGQYISDNYDITDMRTVENNIWSK